jgi:hypothetical protein
MDLYLTTRKSLYFLVLWVAAFASCKKDDDTAFDQSPDERINATISKYQSLLSGAQHGWVGVVQPTGGGAYSFYFKFNDANRVTMYSDFDAESAVTARESSYRLKALQQPSLLFDTYSYLHLLSDPNENTITVQSNVNGLKGGQLGQGLQSDFEFAIDSARGDTVWMTGRQHGTRAFMVKATQAEAAAYAGGQLARGLLQLQNLNKILYYFKRLTFGAKTYDVSINDNNKTIVFTWVDGSGNIQTFSTRYFYTVNGIGLVDAFHDGSQTITGITDITWNAGPGTFSVRVNNNAGTITGVNSPVAVDKGAPARWWNLAVDNGTYYISVDGFHVNGVDDAYNIKSLTNGTWSYFYFLYWPGVNTGNDAFAPVFINAARDEINLFYGSAPRVPTISADGRVVFRELGTVGNTPYPTSGPAAQTRAQMYNAGGYYFVQTSATTFDMVSAADSRVWINWELLL